jgi:nonsense-mediated mRNA decay protein 3
MHLIDPASLQSVDVPAHVFWRSPFEPLASTPELVEFTVLDIEPSGPIRGKLVLADAQVAVNAAFRSSASKSGSNADMDSDYAADNQIYHTRTHLGNILQPGDAVLGYHLTKSNFNSDEYAALTSSRVPDIVLVRKTYPNRRKKNKTRQWRLKSMAKEAEGEDAVEDTSGKSAGVIGRMGGRDQKKVDEDYELFLRDIEEDEEMRAAVNMYKKPGSGSGMAGGKTKKQRAKEGAMDVDSEVKTPAAVPEASMTDAEDEDEPDFPEVKLNELLEDFDEMTLGESDK